MRVTHLKSATVLIEQGGLRVLCDPWLTDGEYYGAWHHSPPFEFRDSDFRDISHIYVSHIHPDHVSRATLDRLDRSIPVLIHQYESKFLKSYLERLGFSVVELAHGSRTHLGGNLHITIFAADNCDPQVCGKFFGCTQMEARRGSSQIDTLAVFDDGRRTIVNVNDCPFELSVDALAAVRRQFAEIDLLLTGYGGAGPYPQCFVHLTREQRAAAAQKKEQHFLWQAESFIAALRPRWYMPFAGTYVLGGRLTELNDLRGVPELEDAAAALCKSAAFDHARSRCVLLNTWASFDLETDRSTQDYTPVDRAAKAAYTRDVLAKRPLDYELDAVPDPVELETLLAGAAARLETKRRETGFESDTRVVVPLGDGRAAKLSLNGGGCDLNDLTPALLEPPYVSLRVDPRLLRRLLTGPRLAHWNNAEIGSHIEFERYPDRFERGLHHVMSYFHA